MLLDIHTSIKEKLDYFYKIHKIPNIIFHGSNGSGKKTIVNEFINKIYDNNKDKIKDFVMYVNCAHGKGIKFIRDEIKFFAKTHINSNGGDVFKSIIFLNADKLTMDAQSALRRCIELFSHTTRFFIVVEDKYKLLKPILSRFCEIYISEPIYENKSINLYKYNLTKTFAFEKNKNVKKEWLKKEIKKNMNIDIDMNIGKIDIFIFVTKLYEKGYSALDIIELLEENEFEHLNDYKKYELLIAFNKVRKEFRNEKLLLVFILNFIFLDNVITLENMSFI
jgi:DNA polymerase III delta prime subunit